MFRAYAVALGSIILSALLQNSDALVIAGIKPNIVLAAGVVLSVFIESFSAYIFFILTGIFLLQTVPGFEKEILVLAALLASVFFVRKSMPWQQLINVVALIIGATCVFYALTYSAGFWPYAFFESFYNSILGIVWYIAYAAYKTRVQS